MPWGRGGGCVRPRGREVGTAGLRRLQRTGLTAGGRGVLAQDRLAAYKRPKQIVQMDALPHNASGKVERLQLALGVAQ